MPRPLSLRPAALWKEGLFMFDQKLHSPLTPAYWKSAGVTLKTTRFLVLTALLMALRIVVGSLFVPVGENLRVYASFFVVGLTGLICGPWLAGLSGFGADILGYFLFPSGAFFPGYTLSAMASGFLYALAFYRRPITLPRVLFGKLAVSLGVNVALGSCWSAILYGKGYLYYLAKSVVKNALLLPAETLLLFVFFKAAVPLCARMGLVPAPQGAVGWLRAPKTVPENAPLPEGEAMAAEVPVLGETPLPAGSDGKTPADGSPLNAPEAPAPETPLGGAPAPETAMENGPGPEEAAEK